MADKTPIDIMQERMDKQDETIAELKKMVSDMNNALQKGLPEIVATINKQSEEINKHAKAINDLMELATAKQSTAQQPAQMPAQDMSLPSQMPPDWIGQLINLGVRGISGAKPTSLDQMVYNVVPTFFEQMFKGMIEQMNLTNELLKRRIGGEVARAIGTEAGEALGEGLTK